MAVSKTRTAIFSATTLTAAAADTVSSAVDVSVGYGAAVNIRITNGATGPTVPASVQIEVSADNSGWFDFGGRLRSNTGNNIVTEWGGVEIPMGVKFVRLAAGENTVQNVTIDADITDVVFV